MYQNLTQTKGLSIGNPFLFKEKSVDCNKTKKTKLIISVLS